MKHLIVNYFCLPACLSVCLSESLCLSLSLSFLSLSLSLCVCLCPSIFCSFPLTSFSLSLSVNHGRYDYFGKKRVEYNHLFSILSYCSHPPPPLSLSSSLSLSLCLVIYFLFPTFQFQIHSSNAFCLISSSVWLG